MFNTNQIRYLIENLKNSFTLENSQYICFTVAREELGGG